MASIPYSILLSQKQNVLPISTIQEQQKFCKKFLKAHQNFEKYKNTSNSKLAFINENVFLFNQKKQNQIDILTWFNSLQEEESEEDSMIEDSMKENMSNFMKLEINRRLAQGNKFL